MPSRFRSLAALFLLLLPALFAGLDVRPVSRIQEVRVAETAREMLANGDWGVPRYNGELRLQKPPLPYWLTAASFAATGIDAVAVRLPAAIAGILLALLTWLRVRRETNDAVACNSVLVLMTTFVGLRYFRSGEADALLLLFICAASFFGFSLLRAEGSAYLRLLFGASLGLGFLCKGPAALAIPLASLLLWSWQRRRRGQFVAPLSRLFDPGGLLALAVTGFGWYAWVLLAHPDAATAFFARQIDETFIGGNHPRPPYWYLLHWFEFLAPWSLLTVPAAIMHWRQRKTLPDLIVFAWQWLAVSLVLLSLTVNKQTQYALLLLPPVAIVCGHYLAAADGGFRRFNRVLIGGVCALAIAAAIALVLSPAPSLPPATVVAMPLAALVAVVFLGWRSAPASAFLVAALSATAFLFGEAERHATTGETEAERLMQHAKREDVVVQTGGPPGDGALSFHARRIVRPIEDSGLALLLARHGSLLVVADTNSPPPEVPNAATERIAGEGERVLYRVRLTDHAGSSR